METKLNKQAVLDWLSEHELAWEDFINYFEDIYQSSAEVPMDEILGWISEHDELAIDFENKFGISVNSDIYDDDMGMLDEHLVTSVDIEHKPVNIKEQFSNEGKADIKYNLGSNKNISVDSKEYKLLEDLADMLNTYSPNGYNYFIKEIYEDFAAGMQWKNIVCRDNSGDTYQILDPNEWIELMNTGDVNKIFNDIINNEYFQDKISNKASSLFNYMNSLED